MSTPDVEPVSPDAPALRGPRLTNQHWLDLTLVHWAVPPERVAGMMPRGVRPDVFDDGRTYVGLVPFRMVESGAGPHSTWPYLGTFLETNVRLYSVDETGRRGVVFLSLDCARLAIVLGARATFNVPYRWARMRHRVEPRGDGVDHVYDDELRWPSSQAGRPANHLRVRVGRAKAEPTALDHFVTARWGLHTTYLGRTLYVPNWHEPWPLHDAKVVELEDTVLGSVGLPELSVRPPDHVAFSPGVRTVFGPPVPAHHARPESR